MDLVNVDDMVYIYSFFLALFALILSYKVLVKMVFKATKGK